MPALAEIKLVQRTCRHWVARPANEARWLREIELAPCPTEEPSSCILRSPRELAWGKAPEDAIRSLLRGVAQEDWPEQVNVRLFDFSGPAAVVDDPEAESELLSPFQPSPLWHEIRDSAAERRVGLIHLAQMRRAIVPVLALRSSGARLAWVPTCEESVYDPRFAFSVN